MCGVYTKWQTGLSRWVLTFYAILHNNVNFHATKFIVPATSPSNCFNDQFIFNAFASTNKNCVRASFGPLFFGQMANQCVLLFHVATGHVAKSIRFVFFEINQRCFFYLSSCRPFLKTIGQQMDLNRIFSYSIKMTIRFYQCIISLEKKVRFFLTQTWLFR